MIETTKSINASEFAREIVEIYPNASVRFLGNFDDGTKYILCSSVDQIPSANAAIVIDRVTLSEQQLTALLESHSANKATIKIRLRAIREERDRRLMACDFVVIRDNEQKEIGITRKIDDTKRIAWLNYRQLLRDFPNVCDPENPIWPQEP